MSRVISLLPAGTEIVAALGTAGSLVGLSHECDYPPEVVGLPRVTSTPIDAHWPSARIDQAVRELRARGKPVVAVSADQIRQLAPDIIISQTLCEVCAVADGEVHRLADVLRPAPRVVSLTARDVAGIWADITSVGDALDLGDEAGELILGLQWRMRMLARDRRPDRPRILTIEWLDPPFAAGHWVPELISLAGGMDVVASPGEHSRRFSWSEAASLRPDLAIVMLCGFGVERSLKELREVADREAAQVLESLPVWVIDGNAYTSRAGPRVVDGARLIRSVLDDVAAPGIARYHCPTPSNRS
jgi:iron complex transport system substrate-binding protein